MCFSYSMKIFLSKLLVFSFGYYFINCIECPLNIPYAYYNGEYCCHYAKEKPSYDGRSAQDENCDGSDISITSECCEKDAFIKCPAGGICSTPAFNTSEPCPEDFPNPYFYGLYCCKNSMEKANFQHRATGTACQNGELTISSLCCLDDAFTLCHNPPCTGTTYWSLTWHAEGNDDPTDPNFSRRIRVPSGKGITLGKDYDLTGRIVPFILQDLEAVGVESSVATTIALGADSTDPRQYLINNNLENFTLTHEQQWDLFKRMRDTFVQSARTIYTDFETKHTCIQGIVIDLIWTGELTNSRTFLDTPINENDVTSLIDIMNDDSRWTNVSGDRYNRRKVFVNVQCNPGG